ncbi:light-mediated development protein DET1 [Nocardia salmonicida]|uniref:light-mediated development protein DET1 n=1 Tax=Nocardia salmonicida TaxID=53431 RepID=UPI002E2ACC97|nr:light-mediated development protein DET1 [Nocardia salmonicida]
MEQRTPVSHVVTVTTESSDEPERVMLESRDAQKVYVRAVDPCDPEPDPVPLYEGDELIMMSHISYLSIHTDPTGSDGFLVSQRVVPIRREAGAVYARPLAHGETDDGRRVHVYPGENVVLEPRIELDAVDEFEGTGVSGYVPLTPVLFTWMQMSPSPAASTAHYVLAAARRLDLAQSLFQQVDDHRQSEHEGAPAARRAIFALIGATELALVALSRAVDMCVKASDKIGTSVPVPADISSRVDAVRDVRNAYEHIEDRAMGNVWGKPDPDAITIFDHYEIVQNGSIVYGNRRLSLETDIPPLITAARQFLKDVAGN